ncbi:MAG: PAS domain-containing protein [Bacteroidetes bacterium]|nr:PAS domain-containing protein [Bacteroidota bacterium]
MENLPAIPFTCVAENKILITFVGKSCEKVTGFLPEQFTSKPTFWSNRIHPDDKKKVLLTFSAVIKKGSLDQPFRWKCSDGKYKHFVNYVRFAKSEGGRPSYIVGVWQEVINKRK